jgi:hypothetical protein
VKSEAAVLGLSTSMGVLSRNHDRLAQWPGLVRSGLLFHGFHLRICEANIPWSFSSIETLLALGKGAFALMETHPRKDSCEISESTMTLSQGMGFHWGYILEFMRRLSIPSKYGRLA